MAITEEEELKEIIKVLDTNAPIEVEAKILFDSKSGQYSIKIPKRTANTAKISPDKDIFKFIIKTFPLEPNKQPKLVGELVRK